MKMGMTGRTLAVVSAMELTIEPTGLECFQFPTPDYKEHWIGHV